MALDKQTLKINFSQGLETKTDKNQIPIGKFTSLQNSVFTTGGLLSKRNGYGFLNALPSSGAYALSTYKGNLVALNGNLNLLNGDSNQWINNGPLTNASLSVASTLKLAGSVAYQDTAVASNGLACIVYLPTGSSHYYYVVVDSATGNQVVAQTQILSTSASDPVSVEVHCLGNFFILVFLAVVSAANHIQQIAIPINTPASPRAAVDIESDATSGAPFCAYVANNNLYVAYSATGTKIKLFYIDSTLVSHTPAASLTSTSATMISLTADISGATAIVWVVTYNGAATVAAASAWSFDLNTKILAATTVLTAGSTYDRITAVAQNRSLTVIAEVDNNYSYDGAIASHYLVSSSCSQTGTVPGQGVLARSVGIGARAFISGGQIFVLGTYQSPYQNSYFLINSSGQVIGRLGYSNGWGYLQSTHIPGAWTVNGSVYMGYMFQDLISPVNKSTGVASANGFYSQAGCNLCKWTIGPKSQQSVEIGNTLHLTGGLLWMFDGTTPVEHGFNLWPDSVEATWSASGGSMLAQPDGATNTNAYSYQVAYEWTDNQGNIHRSAPSVPIFITTTGSGSSGSIAVKIPTLRLTGKSNVRIVIYRWSVKNQTYYQASSVASPKLNDTTIDSVTFTDTGADSSIIGNTILYTVGGTAEDNGAPANNSAFLFDDRLWLIDAEDQNLLFESKQVISATPVEMSDQLTYYVAPNVGAQGPTGPMICGSAMDDKLILFKASAINYVNGTGPDNTGFNSEYSQPIFITSTVGCSNQRSIVFQPQGLMFEFASQAGNQIWLLGRDLSTKYIGAPVEAFTKNATIQSAVEIPGANQVRFTLSSGITLMYDYYYGEWGSFAGVPAVSSVVYQGLHTYIDANNRVLQETPGVYLDGTNPVLMNFTTGWISPAGLQGYQRSYYFYLLGQYFSPHKIVIQIAYDYSPAIVQQAVISPSNPSASYGVDSPYGAGSPYGGPGSLEQWQINFQRQKIQAFQLTIQEVYDPSLGIAPGAGFTLSGINVVYGFKKGYAKIPAANTTG